MDLTWSFYQAGHRVRFEPAAVCYPLEPHNLHFLRKQLRRWSHGFIQNVRLHWRGILPNHFLRSTVAIALWDALVASLAFLVLLPLLIVVWSRWFALGYVLDAPAVLLPVALTAARRRELGRALLSFPCFYALRLVNAAIMLRATGASTGADRGRHDRRSGRQLRAAPWRVPCRLIQPRRRRPGCSPCPRRTAQPDAGGAGPAGGRGPRRRSPRSGCDASSRRAPEARTRALDPPAPDRTLATGPGASKAGGNARFHRV